MRKKSISPPFNFEHVTHTAKRQLPPLETVDEKDLPGEFWSTTVYQRPRKHLHGIKADDLHLRNEPTTQPKPELTIQTTPSQDKPPVIDCLPAELGTDRRIISPIVASSGSSSTSSPCSFDERTETKFDPDDGIRAFEPERQPIRHPRRSSSLTTGIHQRAQPQSEPQTTTHLQVTRETFYESASSNASMESVPCDLSIPPANGSYGVLRVDPATLQKGGNPSHGDIAYRSKQPLPPLPNQKIKRSSKKATRRASKSVAAKPMPLDSAPNHAKQPVLSTSKPSSRRSSRSATKSPTSKPARKERSRWSAALSDATWEDDVEFCYEQEAESTCDFNWGPTSHTRQSSIQSNGGVRLSASSVYHAHSPVPATDSMTSLRLYDSAETIAGGRKSQLAKALPQQRRRSSVVGHRGFLAARRSSQDLSSLTPPAPIQVTPSSTHVSVLSPVFSIAPTDDDAQKTPLTPGTLKFPRFDSVCADSLSDPESCRNSESSKHRKSSSYGSYESTARRSVLTAGKETNRNSLASVSSLPDLMHSRPKSKLHPSKTVISWPLESLPQSPGFEHGDGTGMGESTILPPECQTQPVRHSFVMRRPQTPGDRASMPSTRRLSSQERAGPGHGARGLPNRHARISQSELDAGLIALPAAGPAWI